MQSPTPSGSEPQQAGSPSNMMQTDAPFPPLSLQSPQAEAVPVFVMLPLDTVNADGVFKYAASRWFIAALKQLKESGIHGVAVDVWWGAVERRPRRYDWSGYRQLFDLVASLGLKLQVVMAFHACGGNVGDNAEVPLPAWVVATGERDPDIFFTDRPRETSPGQRNRECISLFAAEEPGLLKGRSAMQCYVDFMRAFRDEFCIELGGLIEEVVCGAGPCGELRFPSYPEPNGWRFPGIGEFQCYDRRALASLARAASAVGMPNWGNAGPHDAGTYNCSPEETGFFQGWSGRWDSEYGRFFLKWYSQALIDHGDRMLAAATSVFNLTPASSTSQEFAKKIAREGSGAAMSGDESSGEGLGVWRQGSGIGMQGGGASSGSLDAAAASGGFISSPGDVQMQSSQSQSQQQQQPQQQQQQQQGGVSRPNSYASFRSSSISENLNALEDWTWPSPAGPAVNLTLKISGVHWWYRTRSHAAELTAGYYNCEGQRGYDGIIHLCAKYGASLTLTCVEMCDAQHPPEALCGPEGLLRQVREVAAAAGVAVGGENALPCFMPNVIDEVALQRVVYNTQPWGTPLQQKDQSQQQQQQQQQQQPDQPFGFNSNSSTAEGTLPSGINGNGNGSGSGSPPGSASPGGSGNNIGALLPPMRCFTFLRLTPEMVSPSYFEKWGRFMALMADNAQKFKTSPRWRQIMGFTGPQ